MASLLENTIKNVEEPELDVEEDKDDSGNTGLITNKQFLAVLHTEFSINTSNDVQAVLLSHLQDYLEKLSSGIVRCQPEGGKLNVKSLEKIFPGLPYDPSVDVKDDLERVRYILFSRFKRVLSKTIKDCVDKLKFGSQKPEPFLFGTDFVNALRCVVENYCEVVLTNAVSIAKISKRKTLQKGDLDEAISSIQRVSPFVSLFDYETDDRTKYKVSGVDIKKKETEKSTKKIEKNETVKEKKSESQKKSSKVKPRANTLKTVKKVEKSEPVNLVDLKVEDTEDANSEQPVTKEEPTVEEEPEDVEKNEEKEDVLELDDIPEETQVEKKKVKAKKPSETNSPTRKTPSPKTKK